jgi:hypothetical protein
MAQFKPTEIDLNRRRESFDAALATCAANVLRIAAGAGKPHQLLEEFRHVLESAIAVVQAGGDLMPGRVAVALQPEINEKEPLLVERMRIESLRITAARLTPSGVQGRVAEGRFWEALNLFVSQQNTRRPSVEAIRK